MSLGNWIFHYRNAETGEVVEIDTRPDAPFYLQHDGRVYEFSERSFVAEPGVMHFYEAMRLTPCPKIPSKPAEAPEAPELPELPELPEPSFGSWTPRTAFEKAQRLSAKELEAFCENEPGFAEALNAHPKPDAPQELGPNAAVRDVEFLSRAKKAEDQRCMDRLSGRGAKPQQPETPKFVDVGRPELVRV